MNASHMKRNRTGWKGAAHSYRSLLLLLLTGSLLGPISSAAFGQSGLPPFKMLLSSGKYYTAAELPKGKPVVLFYFSPDCDHCKTLMKDVFKRTAELKGTEMVFLTFRPVGEVTQFERTYGTGKHPNMRVGTEGMTFFVRNTLRIERMPFVALFDKKGSLVETYKSPETTTALVKKLKGLK